MTDLPAMKMLLECRLSIKLGRDKVQEACCLYALGELSGEESCRWDDHMHVCGICRALVAEYKRIMLFDLPTIAATQAQDDIVELKPKVDRDRLLANIRDRADATQRRQREQLPQAVPTFKLFRGNRPDRPRWVLAGLGWATAAILLVAVGVHATGPRSAAPELAAQPRSAAPEVVAQISALQAQVDAAQTRARELSGRLLYAQTETKKSALASALSIAQSKDLASTNQALEAQLKDEQVKLDQASAALELTRQRLKDEIATGDSLRTDLTNVYNRLDRESGEVARLQRVAATTTNHFPLANQPLAESDAKEILGARDLHIVDVYDVDSSGKSSRAYGRIYFVNRNELIFYAFDLAKLESGHKVVAFQAWGFRQPQSSTVESLGLFYLENATLNRWTLRVSDPQVISRIDSLFVTVEPPGGSPVPKGRRLLMASLAGPPNHP